MPEEAVHIETDAPSNLCGFCEYRSSQRTVVSRSYIETLTDELYPENIIEKVKRWFPLTVGKSTYNLGVQNLHCRGSLRRRMRPP
jgi:hypothetical protein